MDIGCDYPPHLHTDAHAIHCTFMSSVKHPPVIFHEIRKVSKKMQQFASVLRKKNWPPAFCFIPVFWHFMYTLSWKLDPFLDTFQRAATKWPVRIIFKGRTHRKGGHHLQQNRLWAHQWQQPPLILNEKRPAPTAWYRVTRGWEIFIKISSSSALIQDTQGSC